MDELGKYIERTRELRGYETQTALAEAIGKSQGFVSRIERGATKVLPAPEDLRLIASGLQVPIERLLEVAGYLEPGVDEDRVCVPSDSLHAHLLRVVDGQPDREMVRIVGVVEVMVDYQEVAHHDETHVP